MATASVQKSAAVKAHRARTTGSAASVRSKPRELGSWKEPATKTRAADFERSEWQGNELRAACGLSPMSPATRHDDDDDDSHDGRARAEEDPELRGEDGEDALCPKMAALILRCNTRKPAQMNEAWRSWLNELQLGLHMSGQSRSQLLREAVGVRWQCVG